MQVQYPKQRRGFTKWLRWGEVNRAAVILGLANGTGQGTTNGILKKRRAAGDVIRVKAGRAQGSPAFYAARKRRAR